MVTGGSAGDRYNFYISTSQRTTTTNATAPSGTSSTDSSLTEQQSKDLLLYGVYAMGAAIVLRLFLNVLSGLWIVVLPLLYLYLVATCPAQESFDGKQQLKRVLRGHHLPENHPEKPKGWFEKSVARVAATLTAELATMPGYSVEQMNVGNAVIVSIIDVPSVQMQYYWVGAAHQWWFITGRKTKSTT